MTNQEVGKPENDVDETKSSGRWWEFYFIRYALGTVFGILIIYALAQRGLQIPFPQGEVSELTKSENIPFLIGYGLAFCYLASAPILVFHAGRFSWTPNVINGWTVVTGAVSTLIGVSWIFCVGKRTGTTAGQSVVIAITVIVFLMVMASQVTAVIRTVWRPDRLWEFYKKLDVNRRIPANAKLVESYRHLREHGNAFFVVFLELLLGAMLYIASHFDILSGAEFKKVTLPASTAMSQSGMTLSLSCKGLCGAIAITPNTARTDATDIKSDVRTEPDDSGFDQVVMLIFLWILPATFVWTIGNYLEAQFKDDDDLHPPDGSIKKTIVTAPKPWWKKFTWS